MAEAGCRNDVLWPAVFDDGIATASGEMWRDVVDLLALGTTGGGDIMYGGGAPSFA